MGRKIKSDFVERLGDFENGMEKLMLPFSSIFARHELNLREGLLADIREYIQKEHFTEGSEFIREFVGMCRAQNLELEDTSRLFLLVMIAFVGNLSNVGSWTACWASLCPSRLSLIREEIDADDPHLDSSGTGNKCALLESTLMESLRRTQGSFTFRMVMEELELATAKGHRYLLPKGSLIVMAPRESMTSKKIWDQPCDFSPGRFENHKLLAVQHRHSDKAAASQDGFHEKYKQDRTHPKELTEDQKLSFQPFGAGKDKCKGRFFAQNTIVPFVKWFVMNFDIILGSEENYSTLVPTTRCLKFRNPPIDDTKAILRRREGTVIATRREKAEG
ncbi:hypothetical protein KC333_g9095 [Hortaea werneckii]|nr:hypothetical protein KC342_g15559 [Hortaea werneckii]KAI7151773.1 hypothetical protein KC349_g9326 [Hortaea werneckii]KAI7208556.1 hypothetical protein KC333_g9095 [Hortaea werneckii]KAI7301288.1 hypothetical protein KC326_g9185 [Hortaea werneckii]KAI7548633.1 hypothetical protein KC331_g4293 [Hortaea werneckii]